MVSIQPYVVVRKLGKAGEVRDYPAHTLVSCDVAGSFDGAANRGFGPLVRYIQGSNHHGRQIAMTAPVLHAPQPWNAHTISFVLPENMTNDDVPLPSDARVVVHQVPRRLVAALRFSGSLNHSRATSMSRLLLDALAAEGLKPSGEVFFGQYDPPWKPGIVRRNEALVVVEETLK
jgi:hypothetical protein